MIIYARDAVEIGYCVQGIKDFCKRYDIDFKNMIKEGIDSEVLIGTGDAMALKVVEHAKKKRSGVI